MRTKINKKYIIIYIISIIIIYFFLYIIKRNIVTYQNKPIKNEIIKSSIIDEKNNIEVYFPYFRNKKIDSNILNMIYKEVLIYKTQDKNKKFLKINYEINNFEEYNNILFYIYKNEEKRIYNILINDKEILSIYDIFNKDKLTNKINKEIIERYKYNINYNINSLTYIIKEYQIIVIIYINNEKNEIKIDKNEIL